MRELVSEDEPGQRRECAGNEQRRPGLEIVGQCLPIGAAHVANELPHVGWALEHDGIGMKRGRRLFTEDHAPEQIVDLLQARHDTIRFGFVEIAVHAEMTAGDARPALPGLLRCAQPLGQARDAEQSAHTQQAGGSPVHRCEVTTFGVL